MINDLIDLEPLLGQYDPGQILVGPLLGGSIDPSFRHFYIAGKGSKIYQSIGLGFVVVEHDARRQRAAIVEKLRSRFGEVMTFDGHLQMVRAAHKLWPNEETAAVLEVAAVEAAPQPLTVATANHGGDVIGAELVARATHTLRSVRNQRPPMSWSHAEPPLAPPADATAGALPFGDGPATERQPDPQLSEENIASALWDLRSAIGNNANLPGKDERSAAASAGRVPKRPVEGALRAAALLEPVAKRSIDDARSAAASSTAPVPNRPVEDAGGSVLLTGSVAKRSSESARRWASTLFQFGVTGGVAALLVWMMVFSTTQRVSDKAMPASVPAPLISVNSDDDASQAVAAGTFSVPPNQIAKTNEPVPQVEPAPVSPPSPPPQSPQVTGAQAAATPHSGSRSSTPPAASAKTEATPADAARIAELPAPPSQMAGAQAGAASVSTPNSPPPPVVSAQADAAPVSTLRSTTPLASAQAAAVGASAPQSSPAMRPTITPLVSRAKDFLNSGDFAAARLLLRRAAEAGSGTAALMLGGTFDPLVMHEAGAVGIEPDIAQARQWYEKAAELGSDVAAQRLAKLAQTDQ